MVLEQVKAYDEDKPFFIINFVTNYSFRVICFSIKFLLINCTSNILLYQETWSCLSAKVYARNGPCIYTWAGELRAPEIIRSQ